jgi:hypothetical protein
MWQTRLRRAFYQPGEIVIVCYDRDQADTYRR